jgi:hypothetical protein
MWAGAQPILWVDPMTERPKNARVKRNPKKKGKFMNYRSRLSAAFQKRILFLFKSNNSKKTALLLVE